MKAENEMTLTFPSRSANEAFARAAVACFAAQLDPNLEELNDIKTAVSEAVTNCIVHALSLIHIFRPVAVLHAGLAGSRFRRPQILVPDDRHGHGL